MVVAEDNIENGKIKGCFGLKPKILEEVGLSESVLKHLVNEGEFWMDIRDTCPHYKYVKAFGDMRCDLNLCYCTAESCIIYWIHELGEKKVK